MDSTTGASRGSSGNWEHLANQSSREQDRQMAYVPKIKELVRNLDTVTSHDKKMEKVFFKVARIVVSNEDMEDIQATFVENLGKTGYLSGTDRHEAAKLVVEVLESGNYELATQLLEKIPVGENPSGKLRMPKSIANMELSNKGTVFDLAVKLYDKHPRLLQLLKEKEPYLIIDNVKQAVNTIKNPKTEEKKANQSGKALLYMLEVTQQNRQVVQEVNKLSPANRDYIFNELDKRKLDHAFSDLKGKEVPAEPHKDPAYQVIKGILLESLDKGDLNKIKELMNKLSSEQRSALLLMKGENEASDSETEGFELVGSGFELIDHHSLLDKMLDRYSSDRWDLHQDLLQFLFTSIPYQDIQEKIVPYFEKLEITLSDIGSPKYMGLIFLTHISLDHYDEMTFQRLFAKIPDNFKTQALYDVKPPPHHMNLEKHALAKGELSLLLHTFKLMPEGEIKGKRKLQELLSELIQKQSQLETHLKEGQFDEAQKLWKDVPAKYQRALFSTVDKTTGNNMIERAVERGDVKFIEEVVKLFPRQNWYVGTHLLGLLVSLPEKTRNEMFKLLPVPEPRMANKYFDFLHPDTRLTAQNILTSYLMKNA